MVRKSLRRILPTGQQLLEGRSVRGLFGALLHNANLWHLNRNSVAWGVSVGLFFAFVPVPGQTLLAAGASILIGCNLPVALCMVMITNPLTMAPLFIAAYKLGAWLWNAPPTPIAFELSVHWLRTELGSVWEPFLLGCFALGASTAAIGQVSVRLIWRIHVISSWRERHRQRMRATVAMDGAQVTREPESSKGQSSGSGQAPR